MWHPANILPPEGYITVDLGDNYVQVMVERTPLNTYLHTEPGVSFTWNDVKRWAEIPPDAITMHGCEVAYRLQ